jgi:hypothetical protein
MPLLFKWIEALDGSVVHRFRQVQERKSLCADVFFSQVTENLNKNWELRPHASVSNVSEGESTQRTVWPANSPGCNFFD